MLGLSIHSSIPSRTKLRRQSPPSLCGPKNDETEVHVLRLFSYHLGQLKAKLAKLKRELITPSGGGGGGGAVRLLR